MQKMVVMLCCLFAVSAYALDAERVQPKIPQPDKEGRLISPEDAPAEPASGQEAVLIPVLNGLVFVGEVGLVNVAGREVEGVKVERLPMLDDAFLSLMATHIGKPVTLATLNLVNRQVVSWMRDNDYPVVDAFAPAGQDITNGVIQFVVLAGKRGQVSATGARYFSNEAVAEEVAIAQGDVLRASTLNEELAWLNRNPFRSVNLVLAPGEQAGQADLRLEVADRFPVRVYTGIEDTGSELTGDKRWLTGVNWGNAFGLGHQLNYQFIRGKEAKHLKAHSVSYVAPLPWRHTVSVSASYIKSVPDSDVLIDIQGKNTDTGLRYSLPRPFWSEVSGELQLGYDYKRSNNNLEFGGMQVYNTDIEVSQFMLGTTAAFEDRFARNALAIQLFFSPANMTPDNETDAFRVSRAKADAHYHYLRLDYQRLTPVTAWLDWSVSVAGQYADQNLVGSEQFGVGGYATVRGYDEFLAVGDHGVVLRNELQSRVFRPLASLDLALPHESLKLHGFIDAGTVDVKNPLPGEAHTRLSSFGVGARYGIGSALSLRVDYGWQLERAPLAKKRDHRVHFSLVVGY